MTKKSLNVGTSMFFKQKNVLKFNRKEHRSATPNKK